MGLNLAAHAVRGHWLAASLCVLLVACGGGSSETPPAPPTELPQTLQVNAPAEAAPLDAPVQFSSNAVDPGTKLKYSWQFGDGSNSTLASPSHSYAKPGVYTVALVVTNEAGSQRSSSFVVSIADMRPVLGKVCSGANNVGWCWQKPLPQGNALLDYFFIDANQGWAVGEAGTVMTTSDGGATWRAQRSGTDLTLGKVVFSTPQIGWIAGPNGFLLKTTDGGAHWTAQSWGQSAYPLAIGATDADKAWLLGSSSAALYLTNDGGARWTPVSAPSNINVQRYVALSTTDIWAASYYGSSPLYHSTDGGASWSGVALPPIESYVSRSINDLQFSSALHGWITTYESGYDYATQTWVSRTQALKTADGGASWQSFNPPIQGASSYKFFDAQNGYAWSAWYGGAVMRTVDGGLTWQALAPPPMQSYNYILEFKAFTLQTLMIKDSGGRVHLSIDSGATWTERSASGTPAAAINSVWFFDSREGMAIGSDGGTHRTSDGGQTWTSTTPQQAQGWRRLQFLPDASVGWIIADSGTIYRSTDKGQTWFSPVPQNSANLNFANDFHFIDAQNGWAAAGYGWYGQAAIYRSTDGGASWKPVESTVGLTGLSSLRFADASHGVAVGAPGIAMISSDAGVTWSPRPTGSDQPMRRVVFIDGQTALAVGSGGAIVRSTDRGQTWTRIESGTVNHLNDVRFATAKLGFAVGDFGTVLVTRDGGLSWDLQPSGNRSSMLGVFFVDEQTGWIVGDQGRILVTATGGH